MIYAYVRIQAIPEPISTSLLYINKPYHRCTALIYTQRVSGRVDDVERHVAATPTANVLVL